MLCQIASWDEFWSSFLRKQVIGSLHNDDGDGNENGKKSIGLDTTTTWNCLILRFFEDGNKIQQLSLSFPELWYNPLEFHSNKICQHLTN